jgi:hypothetical protein
MKIEFTIHAKPFSVNAMFYNTRNMTTAAYKDWTYEIFNQLDQSELAEKFTKIRNEFIIGSQGFKVTFKFYYPKQILFKADGSLSSKCFDLSNIEKPLIDLLFLPKYATQIAPYGCQNMNIDDKYIVALASEKCISPDDKHYINVSIESTNLHESE